MDRPVAIEFYSPFFEAVPDFVDSEIEITFKDRVRYHCSKIRWLCVTIYVHRCTEVTETHRHAKHLCSSLE